MLKRRTCRASVVLGLLATMLATQVRAQDGADKEYEMLQDRPDRLVVSLPNRLIVIAQELPTEPVASVQVWVKTGSIYEQEHVGAGLSHFLEHLLSGGSTSNHTEEENNAILGRIGAQTNAATSLDNVHYYINTTSEHAATAIELMTDWMRNSLITETEFARERDVIQSEFAMGEGEPGRIFWKLTQQARYTAHPARHPTIGYLDEFLTITRDGIYDFYKRMYVPNNMVFVVVGKIDKQKVVDQIADLWKDAQPGELPELAFPEEPEITEPRTASGIADVQRPRIRFAWPGTQLGGEGDYALDLLASILGGGESSRLVRTIRDEARLATDIDAYNLSFPWGEGFFGIDTEPATAEGLAALRESVMAQVERLKNEPVSEVELNRAKRKVMAAAALRNQTAEGIASRLASDTIGMGDPDYLQRYAEKIQSLTAEELQAAAQKFLTPQRLITVTLMPQTPDHKREPLTRPEEPNGEFARKPVEIDNTATLELMRKATATVEESKAIEVRPIERFTLDNGMRVIVQRTTVVPGVSMQLFWIGGLLADEPGREGVTSAVVNMLMRGTRTRTAQQIAEAIEDLGAAMGTEAGNNTSFVTATSLKQDWPTLMELMADVALRPSFPAEEWATLQPRLLAAIARQRDSWSGELRQEFRNAYYGNHPWSQTPLGRLDVVEKLTPGDLNAWHQQMLDAEDAVLVVVGDVNLDEVKAKAEELFGSMPAKPQASFEAPQPDEPTPVIMQVETRKPVAAVQIGMGPGIVRNDPDYAKLQVLATVMSDFPSGWLEQELRGRGPGIAYAVGAGVSTGLVPGYFTVLFNTQPKTVIEGVRRTMGVIERAKAGDVSDADLSRAKAKVLAEEFFNRQGNSSRATGLALDELYGTHDPEAEKFIADVKATDAAALREVAQKYLRNPVVIVLTNEKVDDAELEAAVRGEEATATAATEKEPAAIVAP